MKIKLLSLISGLVLAVPSYAELQHFITRDGHTLMNGNEEFRFAGIHSPELHRIEDDARGVCAADARGWGQYFKWPTADEQENWIKSIARVGQKATRIYVLSIEQQYDAACGRETHILAPLSANGMPRFNEEAMVHYDRMIALADEHDVRLIIPFIDHWDWWGGRKQLAAFYGETEADFYNINSKTYAAYKYIVEQLITRTNTITGRKYYDEKAILAWETGNELRDTNEAFLNDITAHIKSLDANHLIQDGTYTRINDYAVNNPDIDIISNHFYTNVGNNNPEQVLADLQQVDGKKAYLVGEFGLLSATEINAIMQAIVHSEHNGAKAAGGMVWGLRGRRHDGGFYWHREYTGHYSYHYPGFPEGDANQEQDVINIVRDAQAQMQGYAFAEDLPVPEAPKLRAITSTARINWLGAPVGRFYRVERAQSATGPWQTIASNISDGKNLYDPTVDALFSDNTVQTGNTYYYRVFASNESGESPASNIQVAVAPTATVFEAEAANLSGGMFIDNVHAGYTGSGYATGMQSNAGQTTWTVTAPQTGIYDATITYAVDSNKENNLIVNGVSRAVAFAATGSYDNWQTKSIAVQLQEGTNHIAVSGGWGYTNLDSLTVFGLGETETTNTPPAITIAPVTSSGLTAQLNATVSDDGLPQGNSVTQTWSQISGPSNLMFSQTNAMATQVTASVEGQYTVQLSASDGELSAARQISFALTQEVQNQAPTVSISAPQNPMVGESIQLQAIANDDGLPNQTLNYVWTQIQGPAISIQNSQQNTAHFIASEAGAYQIQVQVDDGELSTQQTITLHVSEEACNDCATNLALNGIATASSNDGYGGIASSAVDGDNSTRWASAWTDDEWLAIDLLATYAISSVVLHWETAFAQSYDIEVSQDGVAWAQVATERNGNGGTDNIALTTTARYIRVKGISRATQWGYSLWEMQVWGTAPASNGEYITTHTDAMNVQAAQTQANLTLTANVNWAAASNQSWLTVTPASGSGDATLVLTASANTQTTERTAQVTITSSASPQVVTVTQAASAPSTNNKLEAENAQLIGLEIINNSTSSNGQYVNMQGSGSITWQVQAAESGTKVIAIGYRIPYGNKTQRLIVNGQNLGSIVFDGTANTWLEKMVEVNLQAGTNTITLEKSWGWMQFDYLKVN
ncbi:discoidin domain-containing protein [Saccharophagus degradans]|uniref:CBM35 domain-containing protein n=1 Tax=Saccharophagus degradans TaxID=86304 RepID=UPI001C0803C3|nr:CBM35 domain-containing protein [Saccharophagus degradans]MBU2986792.1 discoidin domain-containing protein [Saccharophagus degradans]